MATETAAATTPTEAPASTQAPAAASTTVEPKAGDTQQPTGTDTLLGDKPAAEGTPSTEEKPAAEAKPAEGAPEKYEFTAPEGKEFDAQLLDTFSAAAKVANLSQEAAQKLLGQMAPALQARQQEQVAAVHQGWRDASTADKEFGGDKLGENMGIAKKALDQFSTPALRTLLEETGLGNHPEVIRMLYRAGKAISEDSFVSGSANPKGGVNAASVLYDQTK